MPYPLRLDFEGAMHHATSRGNNKCAIFLDKKDKRKFLYLYGETQKKFSWIDKGYSLMTNHFHILVETPKAQFSKGMQWLKTQYAKAFNKRHNKSGHLFGRRFWSCLVEKDSYYLQVVRYIFLNPVRANMVQKPEDYRYSSLQAILGKKPAYTWTKAHDILTHFGYNLEEQRKGFLAFLYEDCTKETARIRKAKVLGNAFYKHSVHRLLKQKEKQKILSPSDYRKAFGDP